MVPKLRQEDIASVFRFVTSQIPGVKINVHSDGSSVNLDMLSDTHVALIYSLVLDKAHE